MSNTSNSASGSDAASDLFQNDTHAGGAHAVSSGAEAGAADAAPTRADSHLTVEDAGTTTDASDLDSVDSDPGAPSAPGAPEPPQAPTGGLAGLAGDDSIGHVFDQTNGVIDRLEGDSDGTADSDLRSRADRDDENPAFEAHEETEPLSEGGVDDTRVTGS